MNVQEYCVLPLDRDYAQLLRHYRDELVMLADAVGLQCDCDESSLWIYEGDTRVAFMLSSAGLAAADVRIQRCQQPQAYKHQGDRSG